ncbi:MAG: hypothetical protein AAF627_20420, partial [Myxococcota bacterium]
MTPANWSSALDRVRALDRDERSWACREVCRALNRSAHLDACAACYRTCASIAEEAGWPSEAIRHRFATAFVLHQSLELEEMAG